jgi:VanZ family protein
MVSVFFARPGVRPVGFGWVLVWLPAVFACGVIALESTGTMSAAHTSEWLRPVFERVFGRFEDQRWELLHHLIRKTGHFTGYGLVCLAFLRAWLWTLAGTVVRGWRWRSCLLGVVSAAVVASCDEIHQSFLPSRTGQVSDVLLDTCGAMVMCGLVWVVCWRRRSADL